MRYRALAKLVPTLGMVMAYEIHKKDCVDWGLADDYQRFERIMNSHTSTPN